MEKKWTDGILSTILLLFIISFLGFFISKNPTITGFVLYGEEISTLNWTFDDSNDFSYDNSLIEISNGTAKLVSTTTFTYWNTSTETDYSVTSALYDPSDKTDKVDTSDSKKHKVKEDKIFEIYFPNNLDNGDIISLYITGGDEADIYLCKIGAVCNSPDYGSISYDEEEGWYNITLSSLTEPTKIINIVTQDEVELDYITSTKGDITKALYDSKDKISEIQEKDGDKVEVKKEKLLNLIFDNNLDNNDIVSFYLKNGDETEIYLCDYGESCSSPGYGLVDFNGDEGEYNVTISSLSEPTNILSIYPLKKINVDYIKAIRIAITGHSSTNISYPESASIETNDINIASLSSFLNFYKNDLLNGQNIDYYYSIDSGNSWNIMPSNNNLSGVSISSGKIRIKADFSTDSIETPTVYDFSVSYSTQICNENWNLTYGACLSNDTKLKYYIDGNECGTVNNLPTDNGTYGSCIYNKSKNLIELSIDARQESNVLLEIKAKSNISSDSISIVEYFTNSKNSTPDLIELGKYIDIITNNITTQNLASVTIKIYYTDEDITNANLNEETLKIHYFNETSSQWQVLNSTVNISGNYVEVTIGHLSTFGIFGEEKISETSGSSSSSSGGGGGSSRRISKTVSEPVKTETLPAKEEEIEISKETKEGLCDYEISVSMPEHISLIESDYIKGLISNNGNCKIENLNIEVSAGLKDIIKIENEGIWNIEVNGSIEFLLIKRLESKTSNLLVGFSTKILKGNIKTYSGSLTFDALVQDQLAFEEKIDIQVDLLEPQSIVGIISSKVPVFLFIFLLFIVTFFVFFSKFFRKSGGKLTREQIDKIEEKVEKTNKKYSNEQK